MNKDKKYNLWARKYPAIISLVVPLIFFMLIFQEQGKELSDAKYIANLVVSATGVLPAIFFLYTFLLRDTAKVFPEKIFKETRYPTVFLLTDKSETFSTEQKQNIRKKIKDSFKIDLTNTNEQDSYKYINEAVALIREITRDNTILHEFNCIYGFYRNMTAGFAIDLVLLIGAIIYSHFTRIPITNDFLVTAMVVITILMLLCLYLSYKNGIRYAKRLYIVFLSKN